MKFRSKCRDRRPSRLYLCLCWLVISISEGWLKMTSNYSKVNTECKSYKEGFLKVHVLTSHNEKVRSQLLLHVYSIFDYKRIICRSCKQAYSSHSIIERNSCSCFLEVMIYNDTNELGPLCIGNLICLNFQIFVEYIVCFCFCYCCMHDKQFYQSYDNVNKIYSHKNTCTCTYLQYYKSMYSISYLNKVALNSASMGRLHHQQRRTGKLDQFLVNMKVPEYRENWKPSSFRIQSD